MKSKFLKRISYKMLSFCISFIREAIYMTCKKKYALPTKTPTPFILVAWHGHILMLPFIYREMKQPMDKMNVIISNHVHGDMIVSAVESFGIKFIRGSSRRGAVTALIQAMRLLKNGENICITPDGPKGPIYSVADGAVVLSAKYNTPIIAAGWNPSSFWQLKSWDQAKIPKPFSVLTLKASEPFTIEGLTKEEAKDKIKRELMKCSQADLS